MSKLSRELKQFLDSSAGNRGTSELAACAFSPALETHVLKLKLDLRERQAKCKLLFVLFPSLERRIAFSPSLPDLWFEVLPEREPAGSGDGSPHAALSRPGEDRRRGAA